VSPLRGGVTVGIADTTDSGDPLSLIRPPEGGRISLMLFATRRKSGPDGPRVKFTWQTPHRGTSPSAPGARNRERNGFLTPLRSHPEGSGEGRSALPGKPAATRPPRSRQTQGFACRTCVRERKAALIEQNHTGGVVIDFVCFVGAYPRVIGRRNGKHWAA
jgi:hypothetical protein